MRSSPTSDICEGYKLSSKGLLILQGHYHVRFSCSTNCNVQALSEI